MLNPVIKITKEVLNKDINFLTFIRSSVLLLKCADQVDA
jgi:hypothetical protein